MNHFAWCTAAVIVVFSSMTLQAVTIDSVNVTNTSSVSDVTPPTTFDTQSTLGAVSNTASSSSFTHRMAFVNTFTATGGAAQVHKRNVVYQIDFNVDDPTNIGFEVNVEVFLRGISSVTQTSDGGTAFANGANFAVSIDDSTDAPNTFSNFVPLYTDVNGVTISGMTTATAGGQELETASLGNFAGTTSFSLFFTTATTPTTNLLFGNGQTGFGEIDFGLGSLAANQSVDPNELGHFVTVSVAFVPEPSTLLLGIFGMSLLAARYARVCRSRSPA